MNKGSSSVRHTNDSNSGRVVGHHFDGVPGLSTSAHRGSLDADRSDFSLGNYQYYGVGSYKGKPILDLAGAIAQISDDGVKLDAANGTITYSFLHTPVLHGLYNQGVGSKGAAQAFGLGVFSPEQEAAAREAIQMWDDLIAPSFVEKNGTGADILFANNLDAGQAYAYRPTLDQGFKFQSDVFVADPTYNMTNKWFSPGGYGNTTLIHEIGHSIGLSHPGPYNGTGTYDADAVYAQDSTQFTIMSYFDQDNTGSFALNWNILTGQIDDDFNLVGAIDPLINFAQTPQLHDIAAIQSLYGADPNTRSGETVYGFGSNAGLWVYDFSENPYPAISIYDAGGEDTINASGFTVSQFIDLHAGAFSSIGAGPPTLDAAQQAAFDLYKETYSEEGGGGYFFGFVSTQEQIDDSFDYYSSAFASFLATDTALLGGAVPGYEGTFAIDGLYTSQYQNVSIAYNTTIENAVGGQADDGILGNEANNMLDGQAGNDTLFGYAGIDKLIGGAGDDVLTGGADADTFVFGDDGSTDTITDFESGVDKIDLSAFGVDSSAVHYDAASHTLSIDGTDTTIVVLGSDPVLGGDLIF